MKKNTLIPLFLFCVWFLNAQTKYPNVIISTNYGDMKVMLYDDTPKHADYFLNLVKKGYFDGTLFHRVINHFMIQGGAQDSRNAPAGVAVGGGNPSMEIMSVFRAGRYHRKGALCAPRNSDDKNPKKKSDMSQFYIVQGKVYRVGELDTIEMAVNVPIKNALIRTHYNPHKEELAALKTSDSGRFNAKLDSILHVVDSLYEPAPGKFFFLPQQKNDYTTVGGARNLDGEYTVYGQVVAGLDVIDKIAALATDKRERPVKDAKILRVYLEK